MTTRFPYTFKVNPKQEIVSIAILALKLMYLLSYKYFTNCHFLLTFRIFGAAKLRNPINFGSWMAFAVPLSLLLLVLCWLWLQLAFFGRG